MSDFSAPRPLTQLIFYLGSRCNLACRRCWVSPKHGSNGNGKNQYLSMEKISLAVREALPLGLSEIKISGGETFLYPEFDALIDYLEAHELSVTIESTGAGLTPEQARRLAHMPQCQVNIGLTSGQAENGTEGWDPKAFEVSTRAVRQLAGAGLAPHIIYLITRRNSGQIGEVIRLVEKLGAKSILFAGAQPNFAEPGSKAHWPPSLNTDILAVEELIALGRRIERDLSQKTRLHLYFDQPPAFRGLHPLARIEGQGRCAILNSLGVLPTGEYALCGTGGSLPKLTLGQVGNDPLKAIWASHPTLTTLREGLPDRLEGVCERCVMKTACLGYCVVENYLNTGSFWGPNWFCQSAEQVGLFPAGRLIENQW